MFVIVFRPHQRPAWAETFDSEEGFVDSFKGDSFKLRCNAEYTGEDADEMEGMNESQQFAYVFDRVAHDLYALTRLDDADEVERYLCQKDYCGHHNKACCVVESEARAIGWIVESLKEDSE